MTDAAQIVDKLINTDGIHAFVFICEAADKYLPIVDSVVVALANGKIVKVTDMDRNVAMKVDETRQKMQREDRIIWALRFFKKALIEQLLWMVRNEPGFFERKFGSPPAPEQPGLQKQLQKLAGVDITPFEEFDPDDPATGESPYSGFTTIDAINERLGHYINVGQTKGATAPNNPINATRFANQSYGEIISLFRRGELELRHQGFPGGIDMWPTPEGPYDMTDKEGPLETIIKFPDGWRWLDLHRNCSQMRDDRSVASDIAITGHCANIAGKHGETALELVQPIGKNKYKHQAFFILFSDGTIGEAKGRKNQKPSPRLEKYIFELLRHYKRITGFNTTTSYQASADFRLPDLTKAHQDMLRRERPELFASGMTQNPEVEEEEPA